MFWHYDWHYCIISWLFWKFSHTCWFMHRTCSTHLAFHAEWREHVYKGLSWRSSVLLSGQLVRSDGLMPCGWTCDGVFLPQAMSTLILSVKAIIKQLGRGHTESSRVWLFHLHPLLLLSWSYWDRGCPVQSSDLCNWKGSGLTYKSHKKRYWTLKEP